MELYNYMATMEERVRALEQYVEERKQQQITSPLDVKSQVILNEYFLSITRAFLFTNPSGMDFVYFIAKQGDKTAVISGQNNLISYVPNSTANTFNAGTNVVSGQQITDMADDVMIVLWTTDTMPAGLSTGGAIYYTVNSTGSTFQVSLTLGGAAINFTSNGVGQQFYEIMG